MIKNQRRKRNNLTTTPPTPDQFPHHPIIRVLQNLAELSNYH